MAPDVRCDFLHVGLGFSLTFRRLRHRRDLRREQHRGLLADRIVGRGARPRPHHGTDSTSRTRSRRTDRVWRRPAPRRFRARGDDGDGHHRRRALRHGHRLPKAAWVVKPNRSRWRTSFTFRSAASAILKPGRARLRPAVPASSRRWARGGHRVPARSSTLNPRFIDARAAKQPSLAEERRLNAAKVLLVASLIAFGPTSGFQRGHLRLPRSDEAGRRRA